MKNIKKLSKSAIILYFVELVLAFAIIGLAVSAISAIGLERYKDWKNGSEQYWWVNRLTNFGNHFLHP